MYNFNINYFDLGLWTGNELFWIVNSIFPKLKIQQYMAYGFEAAKDNYETTRKRFNNSNVEIYHRAIASEDGMIKLFHCKKSTKGHSIHVEKRNVNPNDFELVKGTIFSNWIKGHVENFEQSFNIVRANIEGAEWDLLVDLEKNDLIKYIDVFCGSKAGLDAKKFRNKDKYKELTSIYTRNSINVIPFARDQKHIKNLIKILYKKLQDKT